MAVPSRDEPTVPATANVFDRMRTAIAGAAPLARQVDLRSDAADGAWVLEGAVDDGQGPGRLLIAVATRPASSLADPCLDRDYVQGGRCVTRPVPGGLLAVRGLVRADNGVETVVVTYVRADRTSVLAEASNMTLDPAIGPLLPGDPSRLGVTITRDHPVLEVDELVDVVRAVDRALAGCRSVACD
jgi:hypothetical protein